MAVRNDFTAGEVLAAADLNDTFASKVDYALPVNAQTGTTYTFVAADAEKLTTASNAAAVTLTIPPQTSVTWSDNTVLRVVNYGAGAVTIDGGSGVTVTNTSSTIAQYGAAVAIRTGSDAWTVVPFGGGDVPSATVSSPAATGQYTDTGITYDYYTFTSSGTLTVDTAGFADVLVVGGGGGGGGHFSGGGGGGGDAIVSTYFLSAGTATITVGGAGSGGLNSTTVPQGSQGNTSSLKIGALEINATGGGGGGGGGGTPPANQRNGGRGSNGGGGGGDTSPGLGGVANTGFDGGLANNGSGGLDYRGGGGGGDTAVGATGTASGNGGEGRTNSYSGSAIVFGSGGGGGRQGGTPVGAGGTNAASGTNSGTTPTAATANRGGGGGGVGVNGTGGAGGSGIVIVRVKV